MEREAPASGPFHRSVRSIGHVAPADGCIIELAKMNLELYAQPWRHAEAMWPRLFTHHADVAWDDTHKDYTDLPPQIMDAQGAEAARREQQNALEACERRQLKAAEDREGARRRAREQHLQALLCRQ
ncbi:hypothetical protein DUNSADRAFT_12230 [Dunaliella salina]|uniref:Uncharacterized protein n=1 Tax=Dunaliella salina TaxID=3046 RepID=A0ABQ7GBR4_DUNSA|nr:hypothetical protein DUNSADRAFT_12230 [Dunaliella salina]|eukprot:KAF5832050.1 hypothetical protein DUNSADRAFT_12230 [Dunaliella salina]